MYNVQCTVLLNAQSKTYNVQVRTSQIVYRKKDEQSRP